MNIDRSSTITFKGDSVVNFINNYAGDNGGVMKIGYSSTITFEENSFVIILLMAMVE